MFFLLIKRCTGGDRRRGSLRGGCRVGQRFRTLLYGTTGQKASENHDAEETLMHAVSLHKSEDWCSFYRLEDDMSLASSRHEQKMCIA
jgi:hypothetical protein